MITNELRRTINSYLILTAVGSFILSLIAPATDRAYGIVAAIAAVIVALDVLNSLGDAFAKEWAKHRAARKEAA